MSMQHNQINKQTWIPKKERISVMLAIILSTLLVVWQLWSLFHLPTETVRSRRFEITFKNYGSNARLALFVVLANYVLAFLVKQRIGDQIAFIKKGLVSLLRIVKSWHTPIAILAIALIVLHAVAVFMYGFKWNFNNITGLLALIILVPVPISGLLRYRRLVRKWHIRSGVAFANLFLIHAFL